MRTQTWVFLAICIGWIGTPCAGDVPAPTKSPQPKIVKPTSDLGCPEPITVQSGNGLYDIPIVAAHPDSFLFTWALKLTLLEAPAKQLVDKFNREARHVANAYCAIASLARENLCMAQFTPATTANIHIDLLPSTPKPPWFYSDMEKPNVQLKQIQPVINEFRRLVTGTIRVVEANVVCKEPFRTWR